MDEKFLIDKLKQNNPEAFNELVNLYSNKIINTCYGFVQNKEDAEDIAQEVFVEVFFSINSFNEKSKLNTWIYRIAVNKSLDFVKSKNRKKRMAIFERFIGVNSQGEKWQVSETSTPQSQLEDKEQAELVQTALSKLSESQRVAFTLNKYDSLSYAEIAEVMGTSVSAIESHIHRAKTNLKEIFKHLINN